jgi:hypothetical protein
VEPRLPPLEIWKFPILLSVHAFDKLRLIDCTFAEFELALAGATVIEQLDAAQGTPVVDSLAASPPRGGRGRRSASRGTHRDPVRA